VIDGDGLVVTIGYLIMDADTITITDSEGRTVPASIIGYDYESGFGLVRTAGRCRSRRCRSAISDQLALRSEAYVAGVGGEKATLKVKVAGRREFAGYWEYLLDNAIFTVPAYPLWGGSALVGMDGTLMGVGSLLVQEASDRARRPFRATCTCRSTGLKPVFEELVERGRLSTPPRPVARRPHPRAHGPCWWSPASPKAGRPIAPGLKRGDVLQALNGEVLDDVAGVLQEAVGQRPGRHRDHVAHGAGQRCLRGHGAHR
jgi:S1-C subfamily serine protease